MGKRNIRNIIFAFFVISSLLFLLVGCNENEPQILEGEGNYLIEIKGEYVSKFTDEEQADIINFAAQLCYEEEILKGEIKSVKADLVYTFFDEYPRLFIVEIEYSEPFEIDCCEQFGVEHQTVYCYKIGFIEDDKYYYGMVGHEVYGYGKSPYSASGKWDEKKFYGLNTFAVEINGEIKKLCGFKDAIPPCKVCFEERSKESDFETMTKDEQKNLSMPGSYFIYVKTQAFKKD